MGGGEVMEVEDESAAAPLSKSNMVDGEVKNGVNTEGGTNSTIADVVTSISTFTVDTWNIVWKHISQMLSPKKIPEGLSPEERAVYTKLLSVIESRSVTGTETPHLAVITDLAKDYDDLTAMVLLKELHRLGVVKLEGFVANMIPARKRAQFGRGALDQLGLPKVPIATGSVGAEDPSKVRPYPYEFDCSFMAPEETVSQSGGELLKQLCSDAVKSGHQLTFLLLSCLQDIDAFAEGDEGYLLQAAVSKFIIQGGYSISSDGTLEPDSAAANNRYHMPAAKRFHILMQKNRIPSTVYTKVAAFATHLKPQVFLDLEASQNPVGEHLRRVHVFQDLAFYKQACMPYPKDRFVPFIDQEWFLRNRTTWFDSPHAPETPLPVGDEVLPYLTKVIVYDALAALGASGDDSLKALNVLLPDEESPPSIHQIVGKEGDPGVELPEMQIAVSALLKGSLLACQQGL